MCKKQSFFAHTAAAVDRFYLCAGVVLLEPKNKNGRGSAPILGFYVVKSITFADRRKASVLAIKRGKFPRRARAADFSVPHRFYNAPKPWFRPYKPYSWFVVFCTFCV